MRELWEKYKDAVPYLFFGVCTTLVNLGVYWLMAHPLGAGVMVSTAAAWVAAVLFAYVTNRKWVFHSQARGASELGREMASFFGCRLATGVADWLCMYVFVDLLELPDMVVKLAANVLVVVLNYIASKWLIFNKR